MTACCSANDTSAVYGRRARRNNHAAISLTCECRQSPLYFIWSRLSSSPDDDDANVWIAATAAARANVIMCASLTQSDDV
jgi:hypothetical protein